MTLIELLVGLSITAMIASASYVVVASVIEQGRRGDAAMRSLLREAGVRHMLLDWLAGARLVLEEGGPTFRALDGVHEGAPDDELTFFTTARTPLADGDVVVRLFIDRDQRTPERGLTVEFSEWRGGLSQRLELVPDAVGLDARYLSGAVGARQWLAGWVSSSLLPIGAELVLTAASADALPELLRIPVVVAFEGGQ